MAGHRPETPEPKKSVLVQLANYSQLAFIFPAATVVGWLTGLASITGCIPLGSTSSGLILGIVAGFVELIRLVTSSESKIETRCLQFLREFQVTPSPGLLIRDLR